nr:ABC transporter permease [Actinomycetales bacterium]
QVPHDIGAYPGILSEVAVATPLMSIFSMETLEGAPASELAEGDTRLWAPLDSGLRALRDAQAEPLRSLLGDPLFLNFTGESDSVPATPGSDLRDIRVTVHSSPMLEDHARLVDGRWPEAMPELDGYRGDGIWDLESGNDWFSLEEYEFPPAEFVMSAEAAERTGWEVGETRASASYFGHLTLVGTFEALDPADELWYRAPYGPAPFITDDPNLGLSANVGAFLNPAWSDLLPTYDIPRIGLVRTAMWFPISGTAPGAGELETARAQADALNSAGQPIGLSPRGGDVTVRFDSPLPDLLAGTQDRIAISGTLIALLAIGPAVVGAAVLALGTRLVVDRRRAALEQLASRGGSVRQLAGSAAVEGVSIALPAALLGAAAAFVLARVPFAPIDVAAAVALVVAAVWLLTGTTRAVVRGLGLRARRDLTRRAGRTRRIVEATIAVLSLGILTLAVQAALTSPEAGEAATAAAARAGRGMALLPPVALMAIAVIIVVRLYPHLMQWAEGRARARRGAVPFVALARSTRTPAGGLVPVVALVVGVSVGLFSAILTSTVDRGSRAAQWAAVGADLRLDGPVFTEEVLAQVMALEDVREAARIGQSSSTELTVGGARRAVPVVYVDAAALREVQRDLVDLESVPAAIEGAGTGVGDAISAVASTSLNVGVGDTSLALNGTPVEVVAAMDRIPGLGLGSGAVVVDAAAHRDGVTWSPRALLIALEPSADADAVEEQVSTFVRSGVFTQRESYGTGFGGSPLGDALVATQIGAVAVAAAFVGLVLVLTQMLDAPRRARVVAVLRTVGLRRQQASQLAAWELAPTVAVSLAAGAMVGLLVPWVVSATTDLTPLTGGDRVPPLALDPVLVGGVLGVIVAVATLAVGISAWVAGRASIGTELREVGE